MPPMVPVPNTRMPTTPTVPLLVPTTTMPNKNGSANNTNNSSKYPVYEHMIVDEPPQYNVR